MDSRTRFHALESRIAAPLLLLGAVLLSYGLWIPWMGLFGNDLPYLWYYHRLGPWGPGAFAAIDRPFSALFYALSTAVLGETVWHYHVFLLLLRWLSAVLFWWVLTLVWPERKRAAALAALLFAVYPGFRQNPVSLEFILHFAVLDLFLLSLGASLLAVYRPVLRTKRFWLWIALSILGAVGLFWLEYFIGLEILRPIFLWLATRQVGLRGRRQWKRILAVWAPALAVILAFLGWRVFVFAFPTYRPVLLEELRATPLVGLLHLAQTAARDLWTALAGAWLQTLHLPDSRGALLTYLALASASLALVGLFWWRASRKGGEAAGEEGSFFSGELLLGIGLLAMLAGGSIFWLTGIPVTLAFPWDRSTLALMPGASLALAGLVEMLVTPRYRPVIVGGLLALAVGMHFVNAQEYRAEWAKLQDFYWQLTWRAPALKPGTLALFDYVPLDRYSDNDMTVLLNWTYDPGGRSNQIDYKFFDLNLRMGSPSAGLPGLEKGLPVEVAQRGISFQSTTSSTIAVAYEPPGCLKILAPEDASLPSVTGKLAKVLPMTSLEQIEDSEEPAQPPVQLGPEPAHGWCYSFEKAELALQQRDYARIAALGDQAAAANLHPADPSELLPFIAGYALNGNSARAQALSQEAAKQSNLRPRLCALWKQVGGASQETKVQTAAQKERADLKCEP